MDDPGEHGTPRELLERLGRILPLEGGSGLLICGLGEPPFFRSQAREALRLRFDMTSESALDQAEMALDRAISRALRLAQSEERALAKQSGRGWVHAWRTSDLNYRP